MLAPFVRSSGSPLCPIIKRLKTSRFGIHPLISVIRMSSALFLLFPALIHIKRGSSQEKPPPYNPQRVSILEIKYLVVDLLF